MPIVVLIDHRSSFLRTPPSLLPSLRVVHSNATILRLFLSASQIQCRRPPVYSFFPLCCLDTGCACITPRRSSPKHRCLCLHSNYTSSPPAFSHALSPWPLVDVAYSLSSLCSAFFLNPMLPPTNLQFFSSVPYAPSMYVYSILTLFFLSSLCRYYGPCPVLFFAHPRTRIVVATQSTCSTQMLVIN